MWVFILLLGVIPGIIYLIYYMKDLRCHYAKGTIGVTLTIQIYQQQENNFFELTNISLIEQDKVIPLQCLDNPRH